MVQVQAKVGPVRAEWGWGGVGHALGGDRPSGGEWWGRVGPVRAEWARRGSGRVRVGPSRAEWGCGGVGHALEFTLYKDWKSID